MCQRGPARFDVPHRTPFLPYRCGPWRRSSLSFCRTRANQDANAKTPIGMTVYETMKGQCGPDSLKLENTWPVALPIARYIWIPTTTAAQIMATIALIRIHVLIFYTSRSGKRIRLLADCTGTLCSIELPKPFQPSKTPGYRCLVQQGFPARGRGTAAQWCN